MLHDFLLYLALGGFVLGLICKVSTWFRYSIGIEAKRIPTSARISAAIRGIFLTLLSPKVFTLMKVFFFDVIFQKRILEQSFLRWLTHMSIFSGFTMLLFMHALDKFTITALFSDYYPTRNPFMFLRDMFGVIALLGLFIAVYRRFLERNKPRLVPNSAMDKYAIGILAVIMISGVLLEGSKIISHSAFQDMVAEYASQSDGEEQKSLEAYWIEEFGVASPGMKGPFDEKTLRDGKLSHELNCAQCHSRPQWAFAGYTAAKAMRPIASEADSAGARTILWYIHYMSSLFGLAYLPFSKMFHIFATPLSLLANAVMQKGKSDPANMATKEVIELDACTHCGLCTQRCSVAVAFELISNVNILPSEKMASIRSLAAGKKTNAHDLASIQQGLHLCTNCRRCTSVCPAGIDLTDLWFNVREVLLQMSHPEFLLLSPFSLSRGLLRQSMDRTQYGRPLDIAREAIAAECDLQKVENRVSPLVVGSSMFVAKMNGSLQAGAYMNCFRCMTCSNACPVVQNYTNAEEVLGLLPHQIMHAVGLKLWDIVFSSKMLWNCLGCYECQENCPQGVRVADVICELKNVAIARAMQDPSQKGEEKS